MKKIVITLLIIIGMVSGVIWFTRSESVMEKFVKELDIEDIKLNELENSNSTYYYSALTDEQKKTYRIIATGVMSLKENITIEITNDSNYDNVKNNIEIALNAFFKDHPEVFYIDDRYEISLIDMITVKIIKLNLEYITSDKNELDQMTDKMIAKITDISNKLLNCKNEYEKELLIHDIIATNVVYYDYNDYDEIPTIKHTAYGALVDKSAVCDGISKAFSLVLAKNNIESILVTGQADGTAHAWNKVKIDGLWYNVDVTSDKTLNRQNKNNIIHAYFNLTDDEIEQTHKIDRNEELPSCKSNKYNYYIYNDYTVGMLDNFEYKLKQIIYKQQANSLLEFNVTGISNAPQKLVDALYNLNFNNYKTNKITKVQYNKINNNYIVVK